MSSRSLLDGELAAAATKKEHGHAGVGMNPIRWKGCPEIRLLSATNVTALS